MTQIYDRFIIPFDKKFEKYITFPFVLNGVKYVSLINNATIALLIAQKAMDFKGEIITISYSFIGPGAGSGW